MTSSSRADAAMADYFWETARGLAAEDPGVTEGTLMGGACMRVDGEFLAMYYPKESAMIIKLNETRVNALIADGLARPFAPARKVFREWAAVPHEQRDRWPEWMREGVALARA